MDMKKKLIFFLFSKTIALGCLLGLMSLMEFGPNEFQA